MEILYNTREIMDKIIKISLPKPGLNLVPVLVSITPTLPQQSINISLPVLCIEYLNKRLIILLNRRR